MATTINKEQMMELLQSKLGGDIDLSGITDEEIQGLIVIDPDDETMTGDFDDTDDTDFTDDTNDTDGNDMDDDFEDDDLDLADLDESQMTASEKMLYRALKKETEKNRREKLNGLIVSADIDENSKAMLREMVVLGASKEKIEQLIAKSVESGNKSKRSLGAGTRMFSKNKTKATKDITKPKVKIGSRAWGESLLK